MSKKREKKFEGKLLAVTAPSGAGKTTIVRHLLKTFKDQFAFSVSATTREKRKKEKEGVDYYFMSIKDFKDKVYDSDFIEWEEVYEDQYYGTLISEVERIWAMEKHIIFDIDVKGAKNIKEQYGDRCHTLFIKPPSLEVLIDRLKNRKTESEASLKKRIARVKVEMTYEQYFDITLINDKLEVALEEAENIVTKKVLKLKK